MVIQTNGIRTNTGIDPVAAAIPLKKMLQRGSARSMPEIVEALKLLGHDTNNYTNGAPPITARSPKELFGLVKNQLRGLGREQLHVASLNRTFRVMAQRMVYEGNGDTIQTLEPRDVFRDALLTGSDYVVFFHNHPSGYFYPSRVDKRTTKQMCKVGKLLGIEVLDHLICTDDRAFSMRTAKMLPKMERTL